jgi:hypothetical protein
VRSFLERLIERVHAELETEGVESRLGESELAAHDTGDRRIVWIWRGGRLTPALRRPFPHPQDAKLLIRPLYQNEARVEAVLSAPSEGELEALWADLLTATQKLFGTLSVPGEYLRAPTEAVSRRSDRAWMAQSFTWSLFISQVAGAQRDSTVYGTRTVTILGFDTTDVLIPVEGA